MGLHMSHFIFFGHAHVTVLCTLTWDIIELSMHQLLPHLVLCVFKFLVIELSSSVFSCMTISFVDLYAF